MAHIIHHGMGGFLSSLNVKGSTRSGRAHECEQQFGANESIEIEKSQRLQKEGNGRIKKVSTLRPGLAKIIKTVLNSRYIESPKTNLYITEND
jgi:hypothetical protein